MLKFVLLVVSLHNGQVENYKPYSAYLYDTLAECQLVKSTKAKEFTKQEILVCAEVKRGKR